MWKKLRLKHLLKNNKGYTLIEVILSIFLICIILLLSLNLLNYSIITSNTSNYKDEILSGGRYGFEYIIGETRNADKIIDSRKIRDFNTRYPMNVGYIIYNYYEDSHLGEDHEYTSYFIDGGTLYRIKCRKPDESYPDLNYFRTNSGVNFLCENIRESNISIDFQSNILNLDFIVGNDESSYKFNTKLNINCPTDY